MNMGPLFDLIKILLGFLMGMVFITYFKNYLFFKFVKAPIEISSDFFDILNYKGKEVNVEKRFSDVITIINISDLTIKINKIEASIKILDKFDDQRRFMCFWSKDKEKFKDSTDHNIKFLENELIDNKQKVYFYPLGKLRKIGVVSTETTLFPIILHPHQNIKVYFTVVGVSYSKKEVNTNVIIEPDYRFKKIKLTYSIIFRQNDK